MRIKPVFISTCFTLLLGTAAHAQIAFYDALRLEKSVRDGQLLPDTSVLAVIAPYLDAKIRDNPDQIMSVFNQGNPFMTIKLPDQERSDVSFQPAKTAISRIGGLNVTNVADGLAKFLVERTKQELNISFFQQFKDELAKPEFEDLRILFAETYKVLLVIESEIYNYTPYLATLQQAFERDLSLILERLPDVIDNHQDFFEKGDNKELRGMLLSGLFVVEQLRHGEHPAAIISDARLREKTADLDPELQNSLRLFALFSNSIRSKSPERYWLSADSLNLLQGRTLDIYLALIYASIPRRNDITIAGHSVRTVLLPQLQKTRKQAKTRFGAIREQLATLSDQAQQVQGYIKKLKDLDLQEKTYQDYFAFFEATHNLFKTALAFPSVVGVQLQPAGNGAVNIDAIKSESKKLLEVTDLLQQIYLDIQMKQYASAILNTVIVLDTVLNLPEDSKVRAGLLRYGTFMANVAQAQNSDQVKDAIEAIALPPGSARIKRKSKINIALNTYVGLFGGRESIDNVADPVSGVAAPVGVALSLGSDCGSWSLFLSLFDIGAVTAYRFQDGETESLPEISLKNIFAPGANLVWGIPGAPISLGSGVQLGPALRDIINDNLDTRNSVNWRWHGFVAVDIPLLNFYTRTR